KATLSKRDTERTERETELRAQLTAAKAATKKAEEAAKEKNAESTRYEQELSNYRQERHELHDKFALEQQARAKAKRRVKELEKELRQAVDDQAKNKAAWERDTTDRTRLEMTLRAELAAAKASVQKAEAASQTQTAQGAQLKQELATLRQ